MQIYSVTVLDKEDADRDVVGVQARDAVEAAGVDAVAVTNRVRVRAGTASARSAGKRFRMLPVSAASTRSAPIAGRSWFVSRQ